MSGPSQGSPVALALWNANDQRREPGALGDEPRGLEQLVAVGIAVARGSARAGECAVKTTCASVPRTRSASTSRNGSWSCQLSTKTSSARPASASSSRER